MRKLFWILGLVLVFCLVMEGTNDISAFAEEFDVNEQDPNGNTVFYQAIINGNFLEVVTYIGHYPDPFIENDNGDNALSLALSPIMKSNNDIPALPPASRNGHHVFGLGRTSDPVGQLRYDVDVLAYDQKELERDFKIQNRENIFTIVFSYLVYYSTFISNQ